MVIMGFMMIILMIIFIKYNNMENQILEILKGIRPENDFSKSVNFIEEGFLDSFDIVSLVNELEQNFSIVIDGIEIIPENFASIESIKALIDRSEKF